MQRRQHALYLLVLLGVAAVSGPVLYFASWAAPVTACRSLLRADTYLAYCAHPLYGSYEHEAYAFNTEPEAVQSMQRAQILFLGNSRTQFGFSTPQVDAFFQARGATYHLLGFGYGESSAFPAYLFRRYRPAPKVIVINADPFFQPVFSPAALEMFKGGRWRWFDAVMKTIFSPLHARLCQTSQWCAQSYGSTYRDRRTGQWIWHGVLFPRDTVAVAITDQKVAAWSTADLPRWQRDAEAFLADIPLARSCIILTGVPTPQVDAEGMAAAIGERMGFTVVQPHVPSLTSSDRSHFSADSAERWSAAFLAAAAPTIDACLASHPGGA